MNADGVRRALATTGQMVTLRRVTGTHRIPHDVQLLADVQTGAAIVLIGAVQQAADRIMFTSDEIDAAKWPAPPRQADQIIYDDGTTLSVQGRAVQYKLDEDTVFVLSAIG